MLEIKKVNNTTHKIEQIGDQNDVVRIGGDDPKVSETSILYKNNNMVVEFEKDSIILGKATLKSHKAYDEIKKVVIGPDRVAAWYEFSDFKDIQEDALTGVEFIDVREQIDDGKQNLILNPDYLQPVAKEYSLVYLSDDEWVPYNSFDIPKENIIIGVQIDLAWGEMIDVRFNILGNKLDKHAVVKGTSSGFVTSSPSADPAGGPQPIDDQRYGVKDTSPAGATKIVEIGWWCDTASPEANFEVGLYDHDSGNDEPGDRLYVDATNAKGTSGVSWKKVAVDWAIDENTIYWIAAQLDDPGATTNTNYSSESGVGARFCRVYPGATDLPADWGASTQKLSNFSIPIYAVWEAGAPPTTETFTGNASLLKVISDTFTDDASLLRVVADTFTGDASLEPIGAITFTGDSNLKSIETVTFTGNANLKSTEAASFSGDANFKKEISTTFTGDANLKGEISAVFTGDSAIMTLVEATFTGDANLKSVLSTTFKSDASLKSIISATFVGDASLKSVESTIFTGDANLKGEISATYTGDANLKAVDISMTLTGDASLLEVISDTFTGDSYFVIIISDTFTSDASLKSIETATFTGDTFLSSSELTIFTGDANLVREISDTFTGDASLKGVESTTFFGDAIVTPKGRIYSRDGRGSLPADDANLNLFTETEYTVVLIEDNEYAKEDLDSTDYSIFQFKEQKLSQAIFSVEWIGQSALAPASSTIFLQIYNRDSDEWEALDSDSVTAKSTNFTLQGGKSASLSDYYDTNNWLSFRVYQQNA